MNVVQITNEETKALRGIAGNFGYACGAYQALGVEDFFDWETGVSILITDEPVELPESTDKHIYTKVQLGPWFFHIKEVQYGSQRSRESNLKARLTDRKGHPDFYTCSSGSMVYQTVDQLREKLKPYKYLILCPYARDPGSDQNRDKKLGELGFNLKLKTEGYVNLRYGTRDKGTGPGCCVCIYEKE